MTRLLPTTVVLSLTSPDPGYDMRCANCGYGVSAGHDVPVCPMCGSSNWEEYPQAVRRIRVPE